MDIPARFRSTYFWGSIVRLCLILCLIAVFVGKVTRSSFWDVFAELAFVVVFLEILKIPSVYKRLAKIRTGLGMKSTALVNQSSPETKEL